MTTKQKHYINNADFLKALVDYKEACKQAKKEKLKRTRRKKNIYNRGRHQLGILIKNRTYYITTIIIKSRLRILQIIIGLSTIHKKLILKMPSMKKVTTNTLIKMTEPRRCSLQSRQNIKA